jgi:hypothetical protein
MKPSRILILVLALTTPAAIIAWTIWGGFELHAVYELPPEPLDIALADINSDGNLDVIIASRSGQAISILLGQGNGNFDQLEPIHSYLAGPLRLRLQT